MATAISALLEVMLSIFLFDIARLTKIKAKKLSFKVQLIIVLTTIVHSHGSHLNPSQKHVQ
jgi:hypothetical protein